MFRLSCMYAWYYNLTTNLLERFSKSVVTELDWLDSDLLFLTTNRLQTKHLLFGRVGGWQLCASSVDIGF